MAFELDHSSWFDSRDRCYRIIPTKMLVRAVDCVFVAVAHRCYLLALDESDVSVIVTRREDLSLRTTSDRGVIVVELRFSRRPPLHVPR
jgi:hypothetical protein